MHHTGDSLKLKRYFCRTLYIYIYILMFLLSAFLDTHNSVPVVFLLVRKKIKECQPLILLRLFCGQFQFVAPSSDTPFYSIRNIIESISEWIRGHFPRLYHQSHFSTEMETTSFPCIGIFASGRHLVVYETIEMAPVGLQAREFLLSLLFSGIHPQNTLPTTTTTLHQSRFCFHSFMFVDFFSVF